MKRRHFLQAVGAAGAASAVGVPRAWAIEADDAVNKLPEPSGVLVDHCKRILEQNLVREGEFFVIATPMAYDRELTQAFLVAAGELRARGLHAAVVSHPVDPRERSGEGRLAAPPGYALGPEHWDLYAMADFLITTSIGAPDWMPGPSTSYGVTVGNHDYRSDHEYINRPGAKTRWLSFGGDVDWQRRYFPTEERKQRTLRGAQLIHRTQGELRVTNEAGSDWRISSQGRPGHAQYGIADTPGRWDNFGYGCVACGPQEDSAEGVLVLKPGDIIRNLSPQFLDEEVRLTFSGGYVTSVEGGRRARQFEQLLASYDHEESYGIGHFGWGTHERSEARDVGHYHHNSIGSLLYALGMNYAHGVGGPDAGYSGLGDTSRQAPNHTHFAMFDCDVSVGGQRVIERGRVAPEAGGIA